MLACDVPAFVEFAKDRWHVWNNVGGVLHPLGDRWPTVDDPRSQLWLRADATSPWVVDIPLTPDREGRWTNKFLPEHVDDVDNVTWVGDDGIRYLHPEIVLFYKVPSETSQGRAGLRRGPAAPQRRASTVAPLSSQVGRSRPPVAQPP